MVAATVERLVGWIFLSTMPAFPGGPPAEMAVSDWNKVLTTNLKRVVAAQPAYPHMKHVGGGKIIGISSMYSIFGGATGQAYGTSKGGIVQLTESLAVAWAPDNIQVNAIFRAGLI